MQVEIMERRRDEFKVRFMDVPPPTPAVGVHVAVRAVESIWNTDYRYQRYSEWCRGLGIRPAEFEFWWRITG